MPDKIFIARLSRYQHPPFSAAKRFLADRMRFELIMHVPPCKTVLETVPFHPLRHLSVYPAIAGHCESRDILLRSRIRIGSSGVRPSVPTPDLLPVFKCRLQHIGNDSACHRRSYVHQIVRKRNDLAAYQIYDDHLRSQNNAEKPRGDNRRYRLFGKLGQTGSTSPFRTAAVIRSRLPFFPMIPITTLSPRTSRTSYSSTYVAKRFCVP